MLEAHSLMVSCLPEILVYWSRKYYNKSYFNVVIIGKGRLKGLCYVIQVKHASIINLTKTKKNFMVVFIDLRHQ